MLELTVTVKRNNKEIMLTADQLSKLIEALDDILEESKGVIMNKLKEGFYYLKSPNEPTPTLVHGYHCTDLGGAFVFGFNTHDGGGLLPLSDLTTDTKVVPVEINESKL